MAATASPLSSPRLPSPPPIAEDQLGPKSPSPGTEEQQKLFSTLDNGASRRIRPGTKADDMAEGPPLVDLSEIDSAFQLTEHLKALHNFLTHPIGTDSTVAVDRDMALKLANPPDNIDKTLWLYELCRFLTQKVNAIIIALFSDDPPCSSTTCPEMRASEWQYLCAVHDPPKSCGAIDYSCHTLDWAANTLTSPKNFPSRLAMAHDQNTQHQQYRSLINIFRRVYRIFAHAWFQHREMFWKVEGRTGLYIFFKTVCDVYGLIPQDSYTIPPEAEGMEESEETNTIQPPLILRRESSGYAPSGDTGSVLDSGDKNSLSTPGTSTTKRHRQSPTVSLSSVSTVVEESEEDEEAQAQSQAPEETPTLPSSTQESSEPSSQPPAAAPEEPTPKSIPSTEQDDETAEDATSHLVPDSATDATSDTESQTFTPSPSSSEPDDQPEDAAPSQDGSAPTEPAEATSTTITTTTDDLAPKSTDSGEGDAAPAPTTTEEEKEDGRELEKNPTEETLDRGSDDQKEEKAAGAADPETSEKREGDGSGGEHEGGEAAAASAPTTAADPDKDRATAASE
ncbi:unnamed protein product [Periconia digitata]|uniref:Mob1/phocein n=1 Tax=Periconia digitata TaxID=1303443 RepID=A0A9W4XXB8_9PLEO|nr:unnamed protein product [Periconia digitata]